MGGEWGKCGRLTSMGLIRRLSSRAPRVSFHLVASRRVSSRLVAAPLGEDTPRRDETNTKRGRPSVLASGYRAAVYTQLMARRPERQPYDELAPPIGPLALRRDGAAV